MSSLVVEPTPEALKKKKRNAKKRDAKKKKQDIIRALQGMTADEDYK